MKRMLLVGCVLTVATGAMAQGSIVMNNRVTGSVIAPIYGSDPANPTERLSGNPSTGFPAGTTDYTGHPALSGTGYTVEMWAGPMGTADNMLVAVPNSQTSFRTGAAAGFFTAPASNPQIPGVGENGMAQIQIRVWDNQGGQITSWAAALAANAESGFSDSFVSQPLGGILNPSPNLIGLTSFNLTVVPEPSVIALGALGLGALLLRRRKS